MSERHKAAAPGRETEGGRNDQTAGANRSKTMVPPAADTIHCAICRRPLTDPASIARGMGPRCHADLAKMATAILAAGGAVIV